MRLEKLTPSASLVSLRDLKLHLRIDHDEEDEILDGYLQAAADQAEQFTGRAVGRASYRLTLDGFPSGFDPIYVPRPKLVSVDELTYLDGDGAEQSLDVASEILVDRSSAPARVSPLIPSSWPTTQSRRLASVSLTFTAGESFAPPVVVQAIRLAVGSWYANRENVVEGSVSEIPNGFERLLLSQKLRAPELEQQSRRL